jgi:WD40 repeat protein
MSASGVWTVDPTLMAHRVPERPAGTATANDGPIRLGVEWASGAATDHRVMQASRTGASAAVTTFLGDRPHAVIGNRDGTVQLWDLTTRQPVGEPLTGHTQGVCAIAMTMVAGDPCAVTASQDGTVQVWDLVRRRPIGQPMIGHTSSVWAVATAVVDGCPCAVSAGHDGTLRLWEVISGRPIGDPFAGHAQWVHSLATIEIDGRACAITANEDGTVGVWTSATGLHDFLTHNNSTELPLDQAKPGDVIFFKSPTEGIHHAAVVTAVVNGHVFYTQHSGSAENSDWNLRQSMYNQTGDPQSPIVVRPSQDGKYLATS